MEPIFDNKGRQVAIRNAQTATSLDGSKSYNIDASGNLLDQISGKILGHLTPTGELLPDGTASPGQSLF